MQASAAPDQHTGPERADALATLLAPHSPAVFFERYFEKQALHVSRNDPAHFRDAYDVAEVERSIVAGALEHDKFALIKSGANPVSVDEMTIERRSPRARHSNRPPKRVLDARAILAHFDRGYSLNIKDAALFSARLQKYVNRLQQRLGFHIQANVYFTPPKAQGFEVHYDTHDTMVMQIEGRKTWKIYEPLVELPVESQPYSKEEHGANLRLNCEVALEPGDTLYVPHGFPHEAASDESRSLHVTLAFCPIRVIDLLETMLDCAAITDVELRRALPPGWHEISDFPARFAALLAERLPKAMSTNVALCASKQILRDLFAQARTEPLGNFDEFERFTSPASGYRVEMRDDTPYLLRRYGMTLELLIAGKSIGFPAAYAPLFRALECGPLSLGQVDATLPDGVGRALVRALLLEGLIAVR